jgi:hypothetical protein
VLAELDRYRATGQLPRNTYVAGRTPVFVDAEGRRCAVAHLVGASGAEDLVERTRARSNLARIHDMRDDDLVGWADRNGLRMDELALIQPGYQVVDTGLTALLITLVVAGTASLGTALIGLAKASRRWRRTAATATILGAGLLLTSAWLWYRTPDCDLGGFLGDCFGPWSGVRRTFVVPSMLFSIVVVAWIRSRRARTAGSS